MSHVREIKLKIIIRPEEIFAKSTCKCNLCEMINTIEDKWKDWVPQTPLAKSIKKNIDEIPLVQS